jgi:hypothetical protein
LDEKLSQCTELDSYLAQSPPPAFKALSNGHFHSPHFVVLVHRGQFHPLLNRTPHGAAIIRAVAVTADTRATVNRRPATDARAAAGASLSAGPRRVGLCAYWIVACNIYN